MSNYKKTKEAAWKYYQTWMNENTYSPALKCEIRVTNKGWDHINRGSKIKRRKLKDKYNKFNLLKTAKHIIKTSQKFETSIRNKEKHFVLYNKDNTIIVLLKEDKNKVKYFYSVMKM